MPSSPGTATNTSALLLHPLPPSAKLATIVMVAVFAWVGPYLSVYLDRRLGTTRAGPVPPTPRRLLACFLTCAVLLLAVRTYMLLSERRRSNGDTPFSLHLVLVGISTTFAAVVAFAAPFCSPRNRYRLTVLAWRSFPLATQVASATLDAVAVPGADASGMPAGLMLFSALHLMARTLFGWILRQSPGECAVWTITCISVAPLRLSLTWIRSPSDGPWHSHLVSHLAATCWQNGLQVATWLLCLAASVMVEKRGLVIPSAAQKQHHGLPKDEKPGSKRGRAAVARDACWIISGGSILILAMVVSSKPAELQDSLFMFMQSLTASLSKREHCDLVVLSVTGAAAVVFQAALCKGGTTKFDAFLVGPRATNIADCLGIQITNGQIITPVRLLGSAGSGQHEDQQLQIPRRARQAALAMVIGRSALLVFALAVRLAGHRPASPQVMRLGLGLVGAILVSCSGRHSALRLRRHLRGLLRILQPVNLVLVAVLKVVDHGGGFARDRLETADRQLMHADVEFLMLMVEVWACKLVSMSPTHVLLHTFNSFARYVGTAASAHTAYRSGPVLRLVGWTIVAHCAVLCVYLALERNERRADCIKVEQARSARIAQDVMLWAKNPTADTGLSSSISRVS